MGGVGLNGGEIGSGRVNREDDGNGRCGVSEVGRLSQYLSHCPWSSLYMASRPHCG